MTVFGDFFQRQKVVRAANMIYIIVIYLSYQKILKGGKKVLTALSEKHIKNNSLFTFWSRN